MKALVSSLVIFILAASTAAAQESQYKRRGLDAMAKIEDGHVDDALSDLHRHLAAYPEDPEFLYGLTVGHARAGRIDSAMHYARQALAAGLPSERFVAGPRVLLGTLSRHGPFEALLTAARPIIHGPHLGDVTPTSAQIWVRTDRARSVHAVVRGAAGEGRPRSTPPARTRVEDDFTARLSVEGLRPDQVYAYNLVVDGGASLPGGQFRTPPASGTPGAWTLALGACAGYTPWKERIWTTIHDRDPAAFLLMGDNVYHDNPTRPATQRYTYYRRQSRPEWRALAADVPLYAIWDDHDFGENDSWGGPDLDRPPWKPLVLDVFRENWVNPAYGTPETPGVFFHLQRGDVEIFMLDGRYHRTDPRGPRATLLGAAQLAWLRERLKASTATFKLLVSGVPWAPGAKGGTQMTPQGRQPGGLDTWDGFPEERAAIFDFIRDERIEGVVLLSGDRHRSDLWRIERPGAYDLYEFETARLTNMHVHGKMPGALFSYNEDNSFALIHFDTDRPDPRLTYEIVSIDGETVFTFPLLLSQLRMP